LNPNRTIIELKARVENLDLIRKELLKIGAKFVAKIRQVDTYYEVPKGRLKLREAFGESPYTRLIYYERENIADIKESQVFILELKNHQKFKEFAQRILKVRCIVDKIREIYRFKNVQIHLDNVKDLGTFLEFEKPEGDTELDRKFLENLMRQIGIKHENLEALSYCELILKKPE